VKGSLIVTFVNEPLLDAAISAAYDKQAVLDDCRHQLERFVHRALGASRVRFDCVIVAGDPASAIHSLARARGCGLIVVGTQGLRGSRHTFFGSTTSKLLRVTEIPILAVPPRAPAKPGSNWPGALVGCAVDLDEHLDEDVRSASAFARTLNAKLVLLHAIKSPSVPPWIGRLPVSDAERKRSVANELAARTRRLGIEPPPATRVLSGDPAGAIASFARRELKLIVLRLRRGKGLFGSRPGTITYEILTLSTVPVLALPAGLTESA
jgi:nucleotide-binding universal stress UspA family protein